MVDASIAFATHLGWAAVAIVRVDPTTLHTFRLLTATPDDRLASEPYHVAGGFEGLERVPPPSDPQATLRTGLERQQQQTATNLERLLRELDGWQVHRWRAALFTARGRQGGSLAKILASHAQIHVAEGDAVRASITAACTTLDIDVQPLDRRDFESGVLTPGTVPARALESLRTLRPGNGGPWRKEEKLCALAALHVADMNVGGTIEGLARSRR